MVALQRGEDEKRTEFPQMLDRCKTPLSLICSPAMYSKHTYWWAAVINPYPISSAAQGLCRTKGVEQLQC